MLKTTLRGMLAHKTRLVMSLLAVALATAFVAGSFMFTDTLSRTFDRLFASTVPDVTVSAADIDYEADIASGQTSTVPADLADTIREEVAGVGELHPEVFLQSASVVDAGGTALNPDGGQPTMVGTYNDHDWSALALTEGAAPRGSDIVVDADTADRAGVEIGDELRIVAGSGEYTGKVSGIAAFTETNPGGAFFLVEQSTAQEILGADAYTHIPLSAVDGVTPEELRDRVVAAVGDGYAVETHDEAVAAQSEQIGAMITFVRAGMLGFAAISLLVAAFLIVNTFGMLVAQRSREIGLVRAVGATGHQVRRSILIEATLLGTVGATVGLVAGVGIALGLVEAMKSMGMNLKGTELTVTSTPIVATYVIGIVVTVLAATIPARRASRISPMAALTEAAAPVHRPLKRRNIVGGVVGAVGVLALLVAAIVGDAAVSGAAFGWGVPLTLVAAVLLGPAIAGRIIPILGWPLRRLFGSTGRLGAQNVLRNPRRTAATASALMIGVALVAGTAIVGASMKSSFSSGIDRALGADFQVADSATTAPKPFADAVAAAVGDVAGVETVTRERVAQATLSAPGAEPASDVTVSAVDPTYGQAMAVDYAAGDGATALRDGELIVTAEQAESLGVGVGDPVSADFGSDRTAQLTVGAVSTGGQEMTAVSIGTLDEVSPGTQDMTLYVNVSGSADPAAVQSAIAAALAPYPQVELRDRTAIKDQVAGQVDVLLYVVWGMLALSLIIAVLGVVNTLALSVVERTREVGLLRAVGMTRRQVRRMVRVESLLIAGYGATLGLVLGIGWGIVGQRLASAGMTELALPAGPLAWVVIGAVLVGIAAAVGPAVRASRMNVLRAIATE